MIKNDDFHLFFIEPKNNPSNPINDEYVEIMIELLKNSIIPDNYFWYRGTHVCTGCKDYNIRSEPFNIILPSGHLTNSLAVHYLMYHRDEVPNRELRTLKVLKDKYNIIRFKDNACFNKCIYGLNPFDKTLKPMPCEINNSNYINKSIDNIAAEIDKSIINDFFKGKFLK